MSADYDLRRVRDEHQYTESYRAWVARLTPAKRAELRRLGIDAPDLALTGFPVKQEEGSGDMAESPRASYTPDMTEALDGLAGRLSERLDLSPEQARRVALWHEKEVENAALSHKAFLLQRLVGVFLMPGNVKLRAAALAFAANLGTLNGLPTQNEFAIRNGFTRSNLSKMVKYWQQLLDITPSPHMKSARACQSYSQAQTKDHWRKRQIKCPTPA